MLVSSFLRRCPAPLFSGCAGDVAGVCRRSIYHEFCFFSVFSGGDSIIRSVSLIKSKISVLLQFLCVAKFMSE